MARNDLGFVSGASSVAVRGCFRVGINKVNVCGIENGSLIRVENQVSEQQQWKRLRTCRLWMGQKEEGNSQLREEFSQLFETALKSARSNSEYRMDSLVDDNLPESPAEGTQLFSNASTKNDSVIDLDLGKKLEDKKEQTVMLKSDDAVKSIDKAIKNVRKQAEKLEKSVKELRKLELELVQTRNQLLFGTEDDSDSSSSSSSSSEDDGRSSVAVLEANQRVGIVTAQVCTDKACEKNNANFMMNMIANDSDLQDAQVSVSSCKCLGMCKGKTPSLRLNGRKLKPESIHQGISMIKAEVESSKSPLQSNFNRN
eukprot:CAMPEP_0182441770 /NCGR_PEP_ID=MMETSP1172-20130603/775_1 /TAXON_ID=708627 /ORGANISM="Timspurckia oligopyrenoides, Strain CCMP3278" /LENGTH=312 /DNA_ID=CAMNT_0024636299 /DNA_START=109 /DNA_END=1047 /DNA_ORIENTATION=+